MATRIIDLGHGVTVLLYHKPGWPSLTDAWMKFDTRSGKSAAYSLVELADRSGSVTGIALKEWIAERILEQENAKSPTV